MVRVNYGSLSSKWQIKQERNKSHDKVEGKDNVG